MYIYTTAGRRREGSASQLIEALEGKRWRGERPLFKALLEEAFLRLVNSRRMQMRASWSRVRVWVYSYTAYKCDFFVEKYFYERRVFHDNLFNILPAVWVDLLVSCSITDWIDTACFVSCYSLISLKEILKEIVREREPSKMMCIMTIMRCLAQ